MNNGPIIIHERKPLDPKMTLRVILLIAAAVAIYFKHFVYDFNVHEDRLEHGLIVNCGVEISIEGNVLTLMSDENIFLTRLEIWHRDSQVPFSESASEINLYKTMKVFLVPELFDNERLFVYLWQSIDSQPRTVLFELVCQEDVGVWSIAEKSVCVGTSDEV